MILVVRSQEKDLTNTAISASFARIFISSLQIIASYDTFHMLWLVFKTPISESSARAVVNSACFFIVDETVAIVRSLDQLMVLYNTTYMM